MKIIKILIRIQDCRPCNPLTFNPMTIGDYSSRISLQPLRIEDMDFINNLSTQMHAWVCLTGLVIDSNLG